MNAISTATAASTRRRLRSDQFAQFHHPLRLRADSGTLWVTQDGEPDDIQIDAGTSHAFDGHAVITVGTLGGDALFTATPLPSPRGVVGWIARLWGHRARVVLPA